MSRFPTTLVSTGESGEELSREGGMTRRFVDPSYPSRLEAMDETAETKVVRSSATSETEHICYGEDCRFIFCFVLVRGGQLKVALGLVTLNSSKVGKEPFCTAPPTGNRNENKLNLGLW